MSFTQINATPARSPFHAVAEAARKLTSRMGEHLQDRANYRRTFRELSDMTDRELNDIGLARGDIPFIAAETATVR
jgi:uncharacterized protein YjiS (DUF1127 family)